MSAYRLNISVRPSTAYQPRETAGQPTTTDNKTMETVNNHTRTANDATPAGLTVNFAKATSAIQAYARSKSYQGAGDFAFLDLLSVSANMFQLMSRNARKKTARRIVRFERKPTLPNANKLLAYLHHEAKTIPAYKGAKPELNLSVKELEIRKARKEWKAAQAAAKEQELAYKTSKKGFYKAA